MDKWNSVDEVLDFAIKGEEEAMELYTALAGKVEKPWMKQIFASFAKEEEGHKAKLLRVKDGQALKPVEKKVLDLKIGDYLVEIKPAPDITYQDALILAMKREKAAYMLYTNLGNAVEDQGLKDTFKALAVEEANHKLRFETEYDEKIQVWN
ncbi:MAG: ferritin family protein [Elusimicrobiota bacterium]